MQNEPAPSPIPGPREEYLLPGGQEILYRIFEFAPDAIVLADHEGRIIKANAQAERMFGHQRSDLLGQPVEMLIPSRFAVNHIGHRSGYTMAPHARPMGMGLELFGLRRDGTEFPVDIMLSPLESDQGRLVLAVVRDATERKRIEAQAREAREMYIREIHHRIKNNLQVISSLLFLQSTHTADPNILGILKESQSRVRSIALIHEKLYRSTELSKLYFAEYVRDLVTDLFRTYGITQKALNVTTTVEDVYLDVDTAIPCGLIINELVSNVLKHAFPEGSRGEVMVDLRPIGVKEYRLMVSDNGVGLPTDFEVSRSNSLGLKLVGDLTHQLDGSLDVRSGPAGTIFSITFKELQYKERS
jgi:PAS domain S-box-containing protein